jgi:hypothetical protein
MRKIVTKVTFLVPDGIHCNHANSGPKPNPTKRCRFCTEVSKGSYVCVLYNMPLLLESGYLVQKTNDCLRAAKEVRDV